MDYDYLDLFELFDWLGLEMFLTFLLDDWLIGHDRLISTWRNEKNNARKHIIHMNMQVPTHTGQG